MKILLVLLWLSGPVTLQISKKTTIEDKRPDHYNRGLPLQHSEKTVASNAVVEIYPDSIVRIIEAGYVRVYSLRFGTQLSSQGTITHAHGMYNRSKDHVTIDLLKSGFGYVGVQLQVCDSTGECTKEIFTK